MAGLQQYNFFPTDLFYPKPSSPAAKPAVLPLQTPAGGDITTATEDLPHNQQQQPRSLVKATPCGSALVHGHKRQQPFIINGKMPKFSTATTPLSWVDLMDQEEGSDAF